MSILDELYDGNIHPSQRYIRKEGEYQKINEQLVERLDNLLILLNDEQKQLLEDVGENVSMLGYISEKESFMEGFCVGIKMAWEVDRFESNNFFH
ncbi:MAG: hypothetical protein IJN07_01155 [Clostridia bacterium]|nr:hypothetical protein [Clostridia bacterium]